MLLDDLITALSDESQNLNGILLKTKVFLHQIGKKELADWAKYELGGYPDSGSVPEYRRVGGQLKGVVGSISLRYNDLPLPIHHLPSSFQKSITSSPITQSISVIEDWCGRSDVPIQRPVPLEMNGLLSKPLSIGFHVENAWIETQIPQVRNILTQVRSRLLDFMLELKDSIGDAQGMEIVKEKIRDTDTNAMFNHAVFGPNATIIVGDKSAINVSQTNIAGEMSAGIKDLAARLKMALPNSDLPADIRQEAEAGLAELEEAANAEKPDVPQMQNKLLFVQKALEGAAGNLVATGAIAAITSLLGG